ncbi:triose-phosphate isomerase [Fusobacterium perfoetens]|uniref:triose-phosphate isomerase n=1 Tax=Fusobacterium perfoetens TaxID=852 RepID=UPI0004808856|nr:triose-phosphate isomerase [Fusobacterium perfoetens]MCI6152600.1 triose-phosphate isomerase [Fusobacterium perfoetens]MDY3237607.1 triose-phosphate isomerase [Fusobacterium perfoetens]
MRKTIIAGNWKMNKTNKEAVEMLTELKELVKGVDSVGIVIGAPFTALSDAVKAVEGSNVKIAAENVYPKDSGAYTGEVSPVMLKDLGVEYVILGHSERREYFKESDEFINEKVKAVLAHGMTPILCIGEKLEDREAGRTDEVNKTQIRGGFAGLTGEEAKKIVVAYEPVWAIGTGKTATPEIAQETHKAIRQELTEMFGEEVANEITIQYGGSMKPNNAKELLAQADIDGGLIGGASLKATDFYDIIKAAL